MGDGGGAMVQPVQQTAAQPAPQPSAQTATEQRSAVSDPAFEAWKAELKRHAQSGARAMTRTLMEEAERSAGGDSSLIEHPQPTHPLPPQLVDGQYAQPALQHEPQPSQPPVQPQAQPEQTQPVSQEQAEPQVKPTESIVLLDAEGRPHTFTPEQIAAYIKGFYQYDSQLKAINEQLAAREAELKRREQEFEDRLNNSDEGLFLRFIEENDEFRDGVLKLIDQIGASPRLQQSREERRVAEMEAKLAKLEQERQAEIQAAQARAAEAQRQAVVNEVRAAVQAMNRQYGLSEKTLARLTDSAVLNLNLGRLPFEPKAIIDWFQAQMREEYEERQRELAAARSAYLSQKQAAPPPPPTGGGVTPAQRTPLPPGRERIRAAAERLRAAIGARG